MEGLKNRLQLTISGFLSGVALAAAILLGTTFGASALLNSELYSKSRLISMIVTQDSVGLGDLVQDRRNVDMLLKFVGAVTSAYINFELIPVNEARTFAAVFESVRGEITIDKFEYHRKDLTITGTATDVAAYEAFAARLRETDYFEGVNGHHYTTQDDSIRFELECTAQTVSAFLDFSGQ